MSQIKEIWASLQETQEALDHTQSLFVNCAELVNKVMQEELHDDLITHCDCGALLHTPDSKETGECNVCRGVAPLL